MVSWPSFDEGPSAKPGQNPLTGFSPGVCVVSLAPIGLVVGRHPKTDWRNTILSYAKSPFLTDTYFATGGAS